jgi:hypothetical protein
MKAVRSVRESSSSIEKKKSKSPFFFFLSLDFLNFFKGIVIEECWRANKNQPDVTKVQPRK